MRSCCLDDKSHQREEETLGTPVEGKTQSQSKELKLLSDSFCSLTTARLVALGIALAVLLQKGYVLLRQ